MTNKYQSEIERLTVLAQNRGPGDAASLGIVIDALRTDFDRRTRISALTDLSSSLHEIDRPILVRNLLRGDDVIQDMLVTALHSPFWDLDMVLALLAELASASVPNRYLLIEALLSAMTYGHKKDMRSESALLAYVDDGDAVTRALAVEGLGRIGSLKALDIIRPALMDAEAEVRKAASWTLGRLRDPWAAEPLTLPWAAELLPMLLMDPVVAVRAQAAYALGRLRDSRTLAPLKRASRDPHPSVRRRAANALLWMDKQRYDEGPTLALWPQASLSMLTDMETLPIALREAINSAHATLRDDQSHQLSPDVRSAIYASFGSYRDPFANRARGLLGILTARHVLPIYEQAAHAAGHLDSEDARLFIALGEDALMGVAMRGEIDDLIHQVTGGQGPVDLNWPAILARDAALQALVWIDGGNILDDWRRNTEEDCDTLDAVGCASCAYAWARREGFRHSVYPLRAQRFWEWWLNETVPTAWLTRHSQASYPNST